MPCPHNEITIVQRSQRQSAVAAAAYQSGEKLFCEYDQQVKHYPEKRGIVHNEILLPANAPREYADRNTLWNAAEAVEKQWNSQLARRWVLTIPREIPPDQYAVLVREFCEQQFVSKGMIADFAIHDPHPPGHNPHAHVMLTMRAMDEHGKWLPKSRKVYDLDENGERIKLPSGRWKSHKEDTVDWNDQKYCEIWRHEWEVIQNRYLEANDRPERVDLRSYARQGLDIVPTVHEGAAVRQMEKRGIQTNIGNLNREIRAANRLMKSIRQLIQNLKGWITELGEKRKELLAQKAAEEATLLPNLLMKYMEIRKEERKDWTRAGQNRGTSQDLKAVSEALSYLRQKGLSTVEDLEAFLESSGKSAADYLAMYPDGICKVAQRKYSKSIAFEDINYQLAQADDMKTDVIINRDALCALQELPSESVHCCVTSPPYFALRDYGLDAQIGQEDTPEQYIDRLTAVFSELYRVLRKDGTLWLNIADTYCGTGNKGGYADPKNPKGRTGQRIARNSRVTGCKQKDLIGIPWLLAFSLREQGWYLRSDIIWQKQNPMPESCKDRPTRCYEHIFLLSKEKKYYYDAAAIAEPLAPTTAERYRRARSTNSKYTQEIPGQGKVQGLNRPRDGGYYDDALMPTTRNKRDVWLINTVPYKGAHFAAFPPKLAETCILAGCPKGGIVIDPFFGSGTTGFAAKSLDRHYIGIELNAEYCALARVRIGGAGLSSN